ncbi:hypothetical protein V6N13_056951 [Hibiscus sabdariffa]
MISQFFVLSQRGDNIVFRDYRGEVPKGSAEIFFRKVKFWKQDGQEEAPPIFVERGWCELLPCEGVLSEDSFRKNFVLVYELLDEVIDFGYVQTTSTEVLKSYVFNEPIVVDAARLQPLGPAAIFMQGNKRMPGTAITKSVVANEPGGRKREEIFVDIIEKISVTFSSSGYILTSEVDGTIQMKSYLTGNPEIRLALNEDLSIGRGGGSVYDYGSSYGAGAVILDDCNFHESVRLDSFNMDRTLALVPPDGEFPVMNHRMTQEFKPPFHINCLIEEAGHLKAEVVLKIRAEFPSNITANTVVVEMPLPKYTTRASFELEPGAVGQRTDFKEANKKLEWDLKKIVGGFEHTLRAKLTFSQESHGNITKEAGPVSMTFTIPMYNASRLQVKYLQIAKKSSSYNPYRWVESPFPTNTVHSRLTDGYETGLMFNHNIDHLSSLVELDISSNSFSRVIPDVFTNLGKLEKFSTGLNNFNGTLPVSLLNSPSITSLDLQNNSLNGPVNLNCSTMVHLKSLRLSSNNFNGLILHSLFSCKNLTMLNFGHNNLDSQIPESFKNLKALTVLPLSRTNLVNL